MLSHFYRQEIGGRPDSLSQAQGEVALHHWQVLLHSHSPVGVGLGHTGLSRRAWALCCVFTHEMFISVSSQWRSKKLIYWVITRFLEWWKCKISVLAIYYFKCVSSFACFGPYRKINNKTVFQYLICSLLSNTSVSQLVSSSNDANSLSLLFLPCSVHLWLGREN